MQVAVFLDFDYYEKYEKQLMGNVYIKGPDEGPSVGPDALISKMIDDSEIVEA